MKLRPIIIAGLVLTLALAVGAVAQAAIPDTFQQFDACLKDDKVRIIDTEAGESCAASEQAIRWGQPIVGLETFALTLTGELQVWTVKCESFQTDIALSFTAFTVDGSTGNTVLTARYGVNPTEDETPIGHTNSPSGFQFHVQGDAGNRFNVTLYCVRGMQSF